MISIVLVSHSRRLAEGVKELAGLMAQGRVSILAAAGVEEEGVLGTDAVRVMTVLEEALASGEAVVFMDQGSAVLSAEMALELLGSDQSSRVHLSSAPFVEGATAAAAAAAAGLPLAAILAEALGAAAVKQKQIGDAVPVAVPETESSVVVGDELVYEWTIRNPHGLHARPSARLVSSLAGLDGGFTVWRGADRANARSINQVLRLSLRRGDAVRFTAQGRDARAALDAVIALCADDFGEAAETAKEPAAVNAPVEIQAAASGELAGIAAAEGIAIGPVRRIGMAMPVAPERASKGADREWDILCEAIKRTERTLRALVAETRARLGREHADIFEAHLRLLDDPGLLESIERRIRNGAVAERAWFDEMDDLAAAYRRMDDEYARAREVDVLDIARHVLIGLGCAEPEMMAFTEPSVLAADDLGPSDTARLDPAMVLGLCLSKGGRTSHSAILARAMGIPAVVCLGEALLGLCGGETAVVDGFRGRVRIAPDAGALASAKAERERWRQERERVGREAAAPAVTVDGVEPHVFANIGGVADARAAVGQGAEGVGLLRTEFLFLGRTALPDEDEQVAVYSGIAAELGGRPLTIRTLDVGGDKPLPVLRREAEENPFLGCRGARLCLANPVLFDTQLRAILRTAAAFPGIVRVMFPMISTVGEFREARDRLEAQRLRLEGEGIEVGRLAVGLMIEVPSAVLCASELAREADFFSIGTNDLTQYVMAADRGNGAVAGLINPLQPAVLRAIATTCQAACNAGIPVGMCGEMAGNPALAGLLLGLGLDELSVAPSSIAAVKAAVRKVLVVEEREKAGLAASAATLSDVEACLGLDSPG